MKKQFILMLLVGLFLLGFVSAQTTSNSTSYPGLSNYNGIQITQLKYQPYPVNPGDYFDIWIEANTGSNSKNATFMLAPKFPFSLDSNENPLRSFGSGSEDVVMDYKVRVSPDAVQGVNQLDLEYSLDGNSGIWATHSFDIKVANAQTDFDLVVQETSGTQTSIAIANTGENIANSLIVRIPKQNNFIVSGTNGQMVGNLASGDYTIVSFNLAPIGRANNNTLEVEMDYTDNIGIRRSVIKDVQFPLDFSAGLNSSAGFRTGNFSARNFSRTNATNSQSGIFKSIWFWLIMVVVLVAILYLFIKHPEKVKPFFSGLKKNKSESGKNSRESPDWVTAERTKRK